MNDAVKKYREKYIESFSDVFDVTYDDSVKERIDLVLRKYLKEKRNIEEVNQDLKQITQDFEFTPFKWILHHIKIDEENTQIAERLYKKNPNTIVYKYFEVQDYGFNLLSEIYEKEYRRIQGVERKAKLFRISTLIENENLISKEFQPKITTTFFKDHKYNYGIFDWGILQTYVNGEIWDNKLRRYTVPQTANNKRVTRSYSFSVSIGEEKYNTVKNNDGSRTTFDNKGNSETHFLNGCIETCYANGDKIFEFPNGAIKKQDKNGNIIELDFEGNEVISVPKENFWNKLFELGTL